MNLYIGFEDGSLFTGKIYDFSIDLSQEELYFLHAHSYYENQKLSELKTCTQKNVSFVKIVNEEEENIYESDEWNNINRLMINYNPSYKKLVIDFTFGI